MKNLLRCSFVSLRGAAVESQAWNLLMPVGKWHGPNFDSLGGSIDISAKMLAEMVANWVEAGRPPLPVRVTHEHLNETDSLKRMELEKAVGLMTDFRVTPEGLEALTEWTPKGVSLVRSGEWNFWSPEWAPQHINRATGEVSGWWLSGTALTNSPYFHTMPAVAASTALPPGSPTGKPNKGQHMTYAKVAAALGMPEDSNEEAIVAECMKMKAATSTMQASLTAAVQKAVSPLEEQLKAATARVVVIETEKQKAAEALFERDVNDVIESAKREGFACEPMRASIVLVAKSAGLDEAKKLAQSAAKVPLATTGVGQSGTTATASVQDYAAALEKFATEKGLTGSAAVRAFHASNPAMAKVAAAPITPAP